MKKSRTTAWILALMILSIALCAAESYRSGDTVDVQFEITSNSDHAVAAVVCLEYDHSVLELIPGRDFPSTGRTVLWDAKGIPVGNKLDASFRVLDGDRLPGSGISVYVTEVFDIDENPAPGLSFSSFVFPADMPVLEPEPLGEFDLDFGGNTIWIYNWWSDDNSSDNADTDVKEYRSKLEKQYNCRIVEKKLDDWGFMSAQLSNKVAIGNSSELCLMMIPPNFISEVFSEDLLMPWDPNVIQGGQFQTGVTELMTRNGKVLGVGTGAAQPWECIFFNKRLLDYFGLSSDEIYDLHKNGDWTWETFEEYLNVTQGLVNWDGLEIWPMTGTPDYLTRGCVFGNGASFFDYDDQGKLVITADSDAAMAGLTKRNEWAEKYMAPQPEGESWDWYKDFWKKSTAVFYVGQAYEGFEVNSLMSECDFTWGCVSFPKGPGATDYLYGDNPNICVIPNIYDEETSLRLQQIYALYTAPVSGSSDHFREYMYTMTDNRAVDEYYAMACRNGHQVADKTFLIGDPNEVLGPTLFWVLNGENPAEVVEKAREEWQVRLDAFNSR